MVKASFRRADGGKCFVFGLSAKNLELLREGKPIAFSLEPLGGSGEVLIMFGETEQHIAAELQAIGGKS
jgi:hypothetical protein